MPDIMLPCAGGATAASGVLSSPGGPCAIASTYMQGPSGITSSSIPSKPGSSQSRAITDEARQLLYLFSGEGHAVGGVARVRSKAAAYVRLCELSR